ncbi:MAG: PSD1 and planctomycete cytochrome C domain-containing protein [Phycisphaerae bacterium]|nr:PSD1 and planctomycete cytochrome C domain-containing protein [Phycisphaerae bacterium]
MRALTLTILLGFSPATLFAADFSADDYLKQIKPVLKERCFACHGALKKKGKLRLDTVASMRSKDVLGKDGEMLARLMSADLEERMPPEGEALKAHEIATIKKWIVAGSPAPAGEKPEADPKSHWAFQRIERPKGFAPGKANPIDAYFAARHKAAGFVAQPAAARTLLLRRLYLDLTGLPPTVEQLASKDALPKIIDDVLKRPQYGERWGRHWMDVWRYSDWYGLGKEVRNSQKHIWRWRDWIVNSLNENKGYDQMVREMLAGDEIAPKDPEAIAATGFLARGYYKFNRTTWLDRTIEHTGKAFMGLTLNCAKCHDHKYDPIDHVDYYKFRAIFEPYQVRVDVMPGSLDLEKNGLTRVYDGNLGAATYLHKRGEEAKADKSKKISAGPPSVLAAMWEPPKPVTLPDEAWRPEMQKFVQEGVLAQAQTKVTAAQAHLEKLKRQKAGVTQNRKPAPKPVANTKQKKPVSKPAVGGSVLVDDFSKARPDLWELVGNDWRYQGGLLSLTKPSVGKSYLRSKAKHPQDFELNLKFQTTGGDKWKSVGIRFDVDQGGNNSHFVYASAYGSGKVHLAHTIEGKDVYTKALAKRPIKLNQEYTLNLKVRGLLINVALNGQFLFAYNLPRRQAGAVQLLAYDAIADFYAIEVKPLPTATVLKNASEQAKPIVVANKVPVITAGVIELAQAKLNLAKAEYALAKARIDADSARRMQLEVSLAKARVDLLDPKQAAKAAGSIKKLEADRKAGKFPAYKPLSVSKVSLIKTKNKDALPSSGGYPKTSSGRRTALAKWLTHRDHPLAARVAVNHIWMRHFGEPLVESVADFGLRAPKPLHQDLLDYLAVELIESGWDMKHLHRLMLSSKTWQRSSSNLGADKKTLAGDKSNHHYWRMNSRRMESQVVRDSLLHLAGTLDLTRGGPSIASSPNVRRRSLYFIHSRDGRSKFLATFDDADMLACYRRSESIVPQQALAMMNSQTAIAASRAIAATFKPDMDAQAFVRSAFMMILGRQPAQAELAASKTFLEQEPKRDHFIHVLINHNDFLVIR